MFRNPFSFLSPITQFFGEHPEVYKRFKMSGHNGLDFSIPVNTEVLSVCNGKVCALGYDAIGYGNYIRILSSTGEEILYAHLNTIIVQESDSVVSGQKIALSGNTGFSTGPHLHLGVRKVKNGVVENYQNGCFGYIDPMPFFSDYQGQAKKQATVEIPEEAPVKSQKVQIQEKSSPWAKEGYDFVVEEHISNGERPQDFLSREEFWLMLYRFTEALEMDMDLDENFEEVDFRKLPLEHRPSEWAEFAYLWAKNMRISNGAFPKEYISREEVWTMIYRLFQDEPEFIRRNIDAKEKASTWARLSQNWVMANDISNGEKPFSYISREEIWLMFLRLAEKLTN